MGCERLMAHQTAPLRAGVSALLKIATLVVMTIAMAATVVAPRPAAAAESPTEFIGTLGTQGLEVIRSSTTLAQKADYFHQVLRQDFDLPGLSRFVLGPYWRVASKAQQQEFRSLLEDYIVWVDGQRFAQYGGETFKVTGSRTDPAGVIVTSQIISPSAPAD